MEQSLIAKAVQLVQDLPELGLFRGEVGVVCNAWLAPTTAYEVEFQQPGSDRKTRTLLLEHQVHVQLTGGPSASSVAFA